MPMVLPLVDEDKPKCYLCHKGCKDIEDLRNHMAAAHKGSMPDDQKDYAQGRREPAPGDVTVF